MSLFRIAWRSIQQRGLASLLTSLSMALGVLLVVAVLAIHGVVAHSFETSASLGYNMIVGAKGGKLQLTLNTVYYLSQPIENLPFEYYLEFLDAGQRKTQPGDPGGIELDRDGRYSDLVSLAVPVCLGDYVGRFRSVGTTTDFLDRLVFGREGDHHFEFAQGRNFRPDGHFEAVVGSVVAREMGFKLGDLIQPTHGDPEGHGHDEGFTVVGILKPSGTANDRVVFVNMEGFYLMADHAKLVGQQAHSGDEHAEHGDETPGHTDHKEGSEDHADHHESVDQHAKPAGNSTADAQDHADEDHADEDHTDEDHADEDHAGHDHAHHEPLPMRQREVTAILVRTSDARVTPGFENMINEGQDAQAVLPIREIFNLFEIIVDPIQSVLLVLTAMICIVSGISILVSIYNSMSERRHEIAVMRALGAGRETVMTIILLESIFLSLGGGLLGWLLAHTLTSLASPLIEARTGVSVAFWDINVAEAFLIPALILLAIFFGFFPALAAYRTDVAKSLSD